MKNAMVVLCLLCFSSGAVLGDLISFNDSASGQISSLNGAVLSVPQFDPMMGTLNSVTITVDVNANGTLFYENTGNGTVDIYTYDPADPASQINSTMGMLELSRNSSTLTGVAWDVENHYQATTFDGTLDFGGTSGFTTSYLNSSDSQVYVYAADLSEFIGNGTVDFLGAASAHTFIMDGGNYASGYSTNGVANVTIQYEYIVPEPATMGLILLGGLAAIRRKRR